MADNQVANLPHKSVLWFVFWIFISNYVISLGFGSLLVFSKIVSLNVDTTTVLATVVDLLSIIVITYISIFFVSKRSQILPNDPVKISIWSGVIKLLMLIVGALWTAFVAGPLLVGFFSDGPVDITLAQHLNVFVAIIKNPTLLIGVFVEMISLWYFLKLKAR